MINKWDSGKWPATSRLNDLQSLQYANNSDVPKMVLSGLICQDLNVPIQTNIVFFRVRKLSKIVDFNIEKIVAVSSNHEELTIMTQDEVPVILIFVDIQNRESAERRIQKLMDNQQDSLCNI